MTIEFYDVLKSFEADLVARFGAAIPIDEESPPTDKVTMMVMLNNTDPDGRFLNSSARVMTGQFNITISAPSYYNKYQMMQQSKPMLLVYKRGFKLPVLDRNAVFLQVRESTPYSTDAHQKINVIIDFQITK
ncbi:hypothetical protein ValSw33_8 [Vibrio phage ValSw3-3]|nr:hypothetical protein ValSw33_8 [Vibrio phage ValSw3-3]